MNKQSDRLFQLSGKKDAGIYTVSYAYANVSCVCIFAIQAVIMTLHARRHKFVTERKVALRASAPSDTDRRTGLCVFQVINMKREGYQCGATKCASCDPFLSSFQTHAEFQNQFLKLSSNLQIFCKRLKWKEGYILCFLATVLVNASPFGFWHPSALRCSVLYISRRMQN